MKYKRLGRSVSWLARYAVLLGLCASPGLCDAGGTYRDWLQYRDSALKAPSLVRFYTFDELWNDNTAVLNLAAQEAPLKYSFVPLEGLPDEHVTPVDSRWPDKKAVRLDRGVLSGPPFEPGEKGFTVAAWVRTHGKGSLSDPPISTGGTILSQGSGYYSGWRLTILYPQGRLGFEIGRPQGSFGVAAANMPDGAWHHVAATWDRREVRVYLDGLLVGRGEYAGDYTPPDPAIFRIGYANHGWGSAIMDVDEVAAWSEPLPASEILRLAYFWAPLPQDAAQDFAAAEEAFWRKDFAAATKTYQALAGEARLAACYRALARLKLGQCLVEQHRPGAAAEEFVAVLDNREIPEGLRSLTKEPLVHLALQGGALPRRALEAILNVPGLSPREKVAAHLSLARVLHLEGKAAEAKQHEEAVLAMEGLTSRDKLNLRLQVAHGLAASKDYEGARAEYTAVTQSPDAPAHYRSYARLCIARTYVWERKLDAALTEYREVAAMAEAPESHRWEAEDCAREVERMKAGKPARDPAASRVQLPPKPQPAVTFYVSPTGSDANPGTQGKPFATLEKARDAIRALRAEKGLPKGGIEVVLGAGEYRIGRTFALTGEDSGTQDAPITYRSGPEGAAKLTGGVSVRGFQPVRDQAILARLPEEARGKVMAVDLTALGITDLGEMKPHGMSHGAPPTMELFFNGQAMPLARWPNKGFVSVAEVTDQGDQNQGPTFRVDTDRFGRWHQAMDPWVLGYFVYLWADDTLPVARLDPERREVRLGMRPAYGSVSPGAPCRFLNLLEEIDEPGEWYLDRST
ncbi:MAG: LamG domain-containing protein, partial [Armatimonadetes bacterium]|nr:LamG domain-containing protein [Armatimonadota bacterium]